MIDKYYNGLIDEIKSVNETIKELQIDIKEMKDITEDNKPENKLYLYDDDLQLNVELEQFDNQKLDDILAGLNKGTEELTIGIYAVFISIIIVGALNLFFNQITKT